MYTTRISPGEKISSLRKRKEQERIEAQRKEKERPVWKTAGD